MKLDHDELAAASAPLNRARSMPAGFYTDPEIFAREREHLFLKHWFFLCREEQLPNPGDYRAFDTPGGPIVLIRGKDEVLRCFANYCRHRGSILLEGEGNCGGRIICPYHAWSYFSDGRLYGCPDMQDAEGFDRVENGLVPLSLDRWNGFVFANFSRSPKPLLEHLGDLPQRFASHRLDRMRCTWKITLDGACNWKLVLENAMETYHTGIVHKNTVGAQQSRTLETRGDWICIQVISGRSIATLPGAPPPFPPIEGLDDDAKMGTYFTVIFPTCQFAVAQDSMWWLNVTPVSHERSRVEIGGCFPEDMLGRSDFAEKAAAYYERWELVGREDVGILEKQQKALASVLYKPGPLSWRDDMVQALGLWVVNNTGL
ncbi:aromatic ring-hydroxylating oxygenase subunit alpha [Rhodoligotrophos ferricapiens]|uniref:aromatic ring-hydroxylating oxygenase subunit alpha n=1 Tax=Rhodoligotrophos ferricapiens TaxID=3069264 RepID=UPI00315C8505